MRMTPTRVHWLRSAVEAPGAAASVRFPDTSKRQNDPLQEFLKHRHVSYSCFDQIVETTNHHMAFNDFACLPYLDKDERAASEDLRRNLPAFAARQCGYQLVLGANDQATAEYASRARKAHDPLPMGIPHPSPHEGRADSRTRSDDAAGGPANAGEQDGPAHRRTTADLR